MSHIIVIGGGPAGMMAAGTAAAQGASVTLLEKNEKLGKKLHITGKGRCNLTNNTDIPGLMSNVISNPRFLHSAFHAMDSPALMAFFEGRNVPLKTERGNRVFPVSDKADDINQALKAYLRAVGVKVELNRAVKGIEWDSSSGTKFIVKVSSQPTLAASAIIIATGGLSYPSTGSTGDGFSWAMQLGHTITPTSPSLVPLQAQEPWIPALTGLSLKNVKCTLRLGKKVLYEELGEMMFTPTGVTGPLVLSASAYLPVITDASTPGRNPVHKLAHPEDIAPGHNLTSTSVNTTDHIPTHSQHPQPTISIDLKPGLTPDQLDTRLLRDFETHKNKDFCNALDGLLPQRLVDTIITLSNIPPHKKIHTITRAERQSLAHLLKNLEIHPTGNQGYKEAVITKGGVSTKEVNPSTLMSKHIPGLFFAGEMLDIDALTGGYNMQIAFSTGYLAGLSAAEYSNHT